MTLVQSGFLDALRAGTVLADGGTGSLIFQLTGRLASTEFTYEALNLRNRALIKGIHSSSLAAGATVLTTNTFAANSVELTTAGVGDKTVAINQAAVQLAREAIADYKSEYSTLDTEFFVIGSIGPGGGEVEAYATQVDTLIGSGVDAILLETFTDVDLAMTITQSITHIRVATMVALRMAPDRGRY